MATLQINECKERRLASAGLLSARSAARCSGALIINADDWGRNQETTDRIFECFLRGTVSSVSAMVLMEDSGRAAEMARCRGIDVGLHLNFTTPFSNVNCPTKLLECQDKLAAYLQRRSFAKALFNPGLTRTFQYVMAAQVDEFRRLYGAEPGRLDGHHHMHLCENVLLSGLLPSGTVVRRNFTFRAGEKSLVNRLYRKLVDCRLARRHLLVDFFFSLPPLQPLERLQRIASLARQHVVELETHPINPEEYRFLSQREILRVFGEGQIAPRFAFPQS